VKKPFDLGASDSQWGRGPRKTNFQIEIEKFYYRTYVHKCQQVTENLLRRDWTLVIQNISVPQGEREDDPKGSSPCHHSNGGFVSRTSSNPMP
jgi:hypothetical protein